jgi:crotonobetainyl-CoA hydratase
MAGPAALVERKGHVVVVTFNRPEAMNAVNAELSSLVGDALEAAHRDADTWAVVLAGAGEKAFCAGADLKELGRSGTVTPPGREAWGLAGVVTHAVSKPLIAAVNGLAYGGGLEILLACDLVVASENARFALPEVKRGLMAAAGGLVRLQHRVPHHVAMEMALLGEPITAATALQWGLCNRVVPQAHVLSTALALAEQLCGNAPLAVQASKRVILGGADEEAAWKVSRAEAATLKTTEDAAEGVRAFAEKRAPRWQAR